MSEHTPGPWEVGFDSDEGHTVRTAIRDDVQFEQVAETYSEEDARLIAAAPDLLEALEHAHLALVCVEEDRPCCAVQGDILCECDPCSAYVESTAAIAKAKGASAPTPNTTGSE